MEDLEGLSNTELKELILSRLYEQGVEIDAIEVDVLDGPRVMVSGSVDTSGHRRLIKQTIEEVTGIADIVDELMVMYDDDIETDERYRGDELYGQDEDYIGTEDAFRSVEDGIPYIPPTSPTSQRFPETGKGKRRRKKRGNAE